MYLTWSAPNNLLVELGVKNSTVLVLLQNYILKFYAKLLWGFSFNSQDYANQVDEHVTHSKSILVQLSLSGFHRHILLLRLCGRIVTERGRIFIWFKTDWKQLTQLFGWSVSKVTSNRGNLLVNLARLQSLIHCLFCCCFLFLEKITLNLSDLGCLESHLALQCSLLTSPNCSASQQS